VHGRSADTGALASLDRARVYRSLARVFLPPDAASLHGLRERDLPQLCEALSRLGEERALRDAADALRERLARTDLPCLQAAHQATFEASGGLRCPPNETSHTAETPQHALTRTFELADVAGFYRAFGVEVTPGTERPDHVSVELEFMQLLAVKEAVALGEEGEGESAEICRDASRAFLCDHLGRWAERFAERVEAGSDPLFGAAARILRGFVAHEAARLGAGWDRTKK
jgi:TorA maturation chaperone TorD